MNTAVIPENTLHAQPTQLARAKSIQAQCLNCSGSMDAVANCNSEDCPLHPYRQGKRPEQMSCYQRAADIRLYCLWCCNGQGREVRLCPMGRTCPLWRYRFGYNHTVPARDLEAAESSRESSKTPLCSTNPGLTFPSHTPASPHIDSPHFVKDRSHAL